MESGILAAFTFITPSSTTTKSTLQHFSRLHTLEATLLHVHNLRSHRLSPVTMSCRESYKLIPEELRKTPKRHPHLKVILGNSQQSLESLRPQLEAWEAEQAHREMVDEREWGRPGPLPGPYDDDDSDASEPKTASDAETERESESETETTNRRNPKRLRQGKERKASRVSHSLGRCRY